MPIVAHLEGSFVGIEPCNNSDYFQAIFNFPEEVYGKIFKVEEMPRPKQTRILCDSDKDKNLLNLERGKKYRLLCSLGVRQPNERNGKRYPASLGLNILNAQPC